MTMTQERRFRRLVLGFHHRAPDPVLRLAAELAHRLHLDLLGCFLEDSNLLGLAGLPFAREIRPLGGTWHALEPSTLREDVATASRQAERQFNEAARGLTTSVHFEIVRGSAAETIGAILREDDIVVVADPPTPAERVAHSFVSLQQAALRSVGAVLLVSAQPLRHSGPIAAIAASPDDPSLAAAAAIARTLGTELIVLQAFADGRRRNNHAPLPERARHIVVDPKSWSTAAGVTTAFGRLHEQMIVVTRGVLADATVSLIASARTVPIMMIEPAEPSAHAHDKTPDGTSP